MNIYWDADFGVPSVITLIKEEPVAKTIITIAVERNRFQ